MQEGMKEGDILLVHEKYIIEILKQFDMLHCKPASTPLEPNVKLFDVRTESMGADMMTKAVGPSILAVNMKLVGMF